MCKDYLVAEDDNGNFLAIGCIQGIEREMVESLYGKGPDDETMRLLVGKIRMIASEGVEALEAMWNFSTFAGSIL